jgi:CxxC motif-containing protein
MKKEITCIICPKSCHISVIGNESEIEIDGAKCLKGREYAKFEAFEPRRIFTSTVKIVSGDYKVVPVRSSKPNKKDDWAKGKKIIEQLIIKLPVQFHQILKKDFIEKGIDLIATKEINDN